MLHSVHHSIKAPLTIPHLPIMHHILHVAKIFWRDVLLYLLLRQPFELAQPESIILEVRLSCHDACTHEEGAYSLLHRLSRCGRRGACFLGVDWTLHAVAGRCVSDNPGVHVTAGCLGKDALGGLEERISIFVFYGVARRNGRAG